MPFTKDEWRVTGRTNIFAGERPIANFSVYSTNGPNWEEVIEENEANARLGAAAPELLAALRLVNEKVNQNILDWYSADVTIHIPLTRTEIEAIRAALAKVEESDARTN